MLDKHISEWIIAQKCQKRTCLQMGYLLLLSDFVLIGLELRHSG